MLLFIRYFCFMLLVREFAFVWRGACASVGGAAADARSAADCVSQPVGTFVGLFVCLFV